MNVIVSAYACRPHVGSEPGKGWNYVKQIASFCTQTTVLTHVSRQPFIEEELERDPLPNVRFVYVSTSKRWSWIDRSETQKTYLRLLYYYLWQVRAYFEAKMLIKEIRYDLIHHVSLANDWLPSYLALLPVPFIWGPVGGSNSLIPASFFPTLGARASVKEVIREATIRFFRTFDPAYRMTMKRCARILTCNHDTYAAVPKKYRRKTQIHSQVGTYRVTEREARDPSSEVHVMFGGLLLYLKGVTYAVQSFIEFNKSFPNSRLTVMGHGPELGRIRRLVDASPHPERIRVLSWVPQQDFLNELSSADILLCPSFHDSGGHVVVEGMSFGIPVICLDHAGPAFTVSDEAGIKVPISSPEQTLQGLVDALRTLAEDSNLRERKGAAARERVREHFLWDRKAEQLSVIYREVLDAT